MSTNPFDSFDSAYMASLNNAYRAAEAKGGGSFLPPEGKYQTIVSAFSLKPSKIFNDELTLNLGFEVLDGEHKGKTVYKYYSIIPEGLDLLKTDMTRLNIDLEDDIRKLGEMKTAEQIIDQVVDITIKHKKKKNGEGVYQNVYIDRSLGKVQPPFENFKEVDDDQLPFD